MDLIDTIRREYGLDIQIDDPTARAAVSNLTQNLEHACRSLSEDLYSKSTHFVLELIQNADDNTYAKNVSPTLVIQLEGSRLDARCNEAGFNAQNVRAICSIGKSTKKNASGYIGEKGIGFKSVFTVADVVSLTSGPYAFKFDKHQPLGMIAPIRTNGCASSGWTSFQLDLSVTTRRDKLVSRLRDIHPSLLLFLRQLVCIEVHAEGRTTRIDKALVNGITRLIRSDSVTGQTTSSDYLLFEHTFKPFAGEEKRQGITESKIVLAFQVAADGSPVDREQQVHAFLPLRSYGFHFIIQADFLTASNREDILDDREWNRILRNEISRAVVAAVTALQQRPELTYTWIRYIRDHVSDSFFKVAQNNIRSLLKQSQVLRSISGQLCRPDGLIRLPSSYKSSEGEPLLAEKYLNGKRYLSLLYDAAADKEALDSIGVSEITIQVFMAGLSRMQRDGSLHQQTDAWWEDTCYLLRAHGMRPKANKTTLRNIKMIPLSNGTWASANDADIFFDSSLSDIPKDLGVKLVRRFEHRSSRHRLLEDLGIKEADNAAIAEKIFALHRQKPTRLPHASLLSHAHFLFKHRFDVKLPSSLVFHVRSSADEIVPAANAYMDSLRYPTPFLSTVFKAPFLHSEYGTLPWSLPDSGQQIAWKTWLHEKAGINVAPKFSISGLSPEFRNFVGSTTTPVLLAFLKQYGNDLRSRLKAAPVALQELSQSVVTTTDGVRNSLNATYLRRAGLERFRDLPFLPLADPNDTRWEFLKDLGVSTQVDSTFYLKELVRISEQPLQSVIGRLDYTLREVQEYYKQLEARFLDDKKAQAAIRAAFKEKRIIYIPPDEDSPSSTYGQWISSEDAVWDGPRSMRSKFSLKRYYEPFRTFLCVNVQLPRCPDDILVQEVRALSAAYCNKALDVVAHTHAHAILADLFLMLDRSDDHAPPPPWMNELIALPFLPVQTPGGETKLMSVDMACYVADISGELADIFRDHVSLVSTPPDRSGGTLLRMHRLFHSGWIPGIKFLDALVQRTLVVGNVDGRSPNAALTTSYRSKLHYARRYISSIVERGSMRALRALADMMRDIRIYELSTNTVKHVYRLGDVVCEQSQFVGIEPTQGCCVVLLGKKCKREERDLLICREIARLCAGVNEAQLFIIFTQPSSILDAMHPARGADDLEDEVVEDLAGVPWRTTGDHILSSAGASTITVEGELKAKLARDLPALHSAAEDNWTKFFKWRPRSSTVDSIEDGMDHLRISSGSSSPFSTKRNKKKAAKGRKEPLDLASLTNLASADSNVVEAIPELDAEHEYNGILGEIYLYNLFAKHLPRFSHENWTSELRHHMDLPHFDGVSIADFMYKDDEGVLTGLLFGEACCDTWRGVWPTYFLEVKSTSEAANEAFHISASQLETASKLTLRNQGAGPIPRDDAPQYVYVLVRVSSVRSSQPSVQFHPDPWRVLYEGGLRHASSVAMTFVKK